MLVMDLRLHYGNDGYSAFTFGNTTGNDGFSAFTFGKLLMEMMGIAHLHLEIQPWQRWYNLLFIW